MTYYIEEVLDSLNKLQGVDAQVRYLEAVCKNNEDKTNEVVLNELLNAYKKAQLEIRRKQK